MANEREKRDALLLDVQSSKYRLGWVGHETRITGPGDLGVIYTPRQSPILTEIRGARRSESHRLSHPPAWVPFPPVTWS
ncbi:hypothetical protein L210DRAFT_720784 [Boletus edulis BED1]|uniref:Uncharacterized protein n=1 Tax=Boletus edulis BED1 TaxID=1328754 RepID=A0AAD4C6C0_BOLED|nr:hypothetical protein L210DRAFT_720784 [Boletus edulis BED1]